MDPYAWHLKEAQKLYIKNIYQKIRAIIKHVLTSDKSVFAHIIMNNMQDFISFNYSKLTCQYPNLVVLNLGSHAEYGHTCRHLPHPIPSIGLNTHLPGKNNNDI